MQTQFNLNEQQTNAILNAIQNMPIQNNNITLSNQDIERIRDILPQFDDTQIRAVLETINENMQQNQASNEGSIEQNRHN